MWETLTVQAPSRRLECHDINHARPLAAPGDPESVLFGAGERARSTSLRRGTVKLTCIERRILTSQLESPLRWTPKIGVFWLQIRRVWSECDYASSESAFVSCMANPEVQSRSGVDRVSGLRACGEEVQWPQSDVICVGKNALRHFSSISKKPSDRGTGSNI